MLSRIRRSTHVVAVEWPGRSNAASLLRGGINTGQPVLTVEPVLTVQPVLTVEGAVDLPCTTSWRSPSFGPRFP